MALHPLACVRVPKMRGKRKGSLTGGAGFQTLSRFSGNPVITPRSSIRRETRTSRPLYFDDGYRSALASMPRQRGLGSQRVPAWRPSSRFYIRFAADSAKRLRDPRERRFFPFHRSLSPSPLSRATPLRTLLSARSPIPRAIAPSSPPLRGDISRNLQRFRFAFYRQARLSRSFQGIDWESDLSTSRGGFSAESGLADRHWRRLRNYTGL